MQGAVGQDLQLRRAHDTGSAAKIGPNAILQLAETLRDRRGPEETKAVFARAGLGPLLQNPPAEMVGETLVIALHDALFQHFPRKEATALASEAGTRTADYIMANRIPGPVRTVLKLLPAGLAAPQLLRAIARHAWTFAGSGACSVQTKKPYWIDIAHNPIAIGGCAWHMAVFERLFTALVSPRSQVAHSRCCGLGHSVCRFEILTR